MIIDWGMLYNTASGATGQLICMSRLVVRFELLEFL